MNRFALLLVSSDNEYASKLTGQARGQDAQSAPGRAR